MPSTSKLSRRTGLTALALALLLVFPATAQTTADPTAQFGELVEVSEVLLDVLVTDGDGQVVVGLAADDFVVVENGEERPVTGASFYSNRFRVEGESRQGELRKPAENEVLADRFFILFFHDQRRTIDATNVLWRQQLDAARQAKRWIEKEMLGGDWVAVASHDVKLKVHSDFTRDRGRLLDAIDRAIEGKDPSNEWKSRRPENEDDGSPALLANLPAGNDLRDETTRMYDSLRLLAEASRPIVGRKNLMLFSIGFGDVRNAAGSGGFTSGSFVSRPDERFYPAMKEALNANNVAIYPIDLTPNNLQHAQRDFMQLLAVDTGGTYHFNFTNFVTPMRQIADEANGYYLLSYLAEHRSGENGYREVQIRPRNPEFEVQARRGYRYGT
ncbi:MAG: VWA domain-containing protein [Acidobacteriota bacterium]